MENGAEKTFYSRDASKKTCSIWRKCDTVCCHEAPGLKRNAVVCLHLLSFPSVFFSVRRICGNRYYRLILVEQPGHQGWQQDASKTRRCILQAAFSNSTNKPKELVAQVSTRPDETRFKAEANQWLWSHDAPRRIFQHLNTTQALIRDLYSRSTTHKKGRYKTTTAPTASSYYSHVMSMWPTKSAILFICSGLRDTVRRTVEILLSHDGKLGLRSPWNVCKIWPALSCLAWFASF